jgi:hypothetical protein
MKWNCCWNCAIVCHPLGPLFILNQIVTLDVKPLWEILIVMSLLLTSAGSNPTTVTTPKPIDLNIAYPI